MLFMRDDNVMTLILIQPAELDSSKPKQIMKESRVIRVARGSGCKVGEVRDLLDEHELLVDMGKRVALKQMDRSLFSGVRNKHVGRGMVFILQVSQAFKFMGIYH